MREPDTEYTMYFRRDDRHHQVTYTATDSAGDFVAALVHTDASDDESWEVMVPASEERDGEEKVAATGLTMAAAFDHVLGM